jgi:pimeloyl-ACP methyl ester carboxylesterase
MPKALVNGINLNYRSVGAGSDLVLVHGLAANHAFWRVDVLLPLARTHRVTVYDLRGHGYSDMPASGYTSASMAEDLHRLLDHLDIEQAHLVGHSYGGVVSLHFAALYPDRVASLTLADSRVRVLQPVQRIQDWPDWQLAVAELEKRGLRPPADEADVGVWLLEQLASPEWREARQKMAEQALFVPFAGWSGGNRSAERWLKLLATTTARADISDVAGLTIERIRTVFAPTLAMYGERSRCLESCRGLQDELLDCRSVIVPGAGHFYPVIRPRFLVEAVEAFLSEIELRQDRRWGT